MKMQSKRNLKMWFKTKQARQQAEKHTHTKEHLETKKQIKTTKSKNQKLQWETDIEWTLNQKH